MNTKFSPTRYLIAAGLAVAALTWSSVRSNASDDHGGNYLQQLSRPTAPVVQTTRPVTPVQNATAHGGNYLQQLAGVTREVGPQTPSLAPPYSYGSLHGGAYLQQLGGQQTELAPLR